MDHQSIRFAGYRDLARVLSLYKELRPQDPELSVLNADAIWREMLGQSHIRVVVAEANQRLASTYMIALIEHVVTLPEFRGLGLGRAVLQYALDFAWSQNCCKVMLMSGMERPEAHRLYEALGFRGDIERGFVIKPSEGSNPISNDDVAKDTCR